MSIQYIEYITIVGASYTGRAPMFAGKHRGMGFSAFYGEHYNRSGVPEVGPLFEQIKRKQINSFR